MATNKHAQHLGSNALPAAALNECYVCHDNTATAGGLASGASHLNSAVNLNFNAGFGYEGTGATRSGGTGPLSVSPASDTDGPAPPALSSCSESEAVCCVEV